TELSFQIGRQIGILVDRKGRVEYVVVGDSKSLFLPNIEKEYPSSSLRLRGLRLIHTHLRSEPLTDDDLTDLALLRLDMVVAIGVGSDGLPALAHGAHVLPLNPHGRNWQLLDPVAPAQLDIDFLGLIDALEEEIARSQPGRPHRQKDSRAILVSVTTSPLYEAEESLEELRELARTSNVNVVDKVIQRRHEVDPRSLMGKGKMQDLILRSMQIGADILIFDQNLNPSQLRTITDMTELRILDRTQLILDIFSQHAQSTDGKIQVELAQLKYLLPRLVTKNTAMSRLTGGIGGRGPGETKLEINRRRAHDRIVHLEKLLRNSAGSRKLRRNRRKSEGLPIISIVGYTNAGKSTLLNSLTNSHVTAEDKLFATLDTSSRRLRFPREREVIITDTVGFIRDLPPELLAAFKATLEELEDADLLLHVADVGSPYLEHHLDVVEKTLAALGLNTKPLLLALNKVDCIDGETASNLARRFNGVAVCALDRDSLLPLIEKMDSILWPQNKRESM
ncbi:GTPase HflX, partial [Candidatus Poribacteria bacterium]|nr:GTPase HflX [Candidatus Poribacteria bacterium]